MEESTMMTLLRNLHSIAAHRGDGLRPEFLDMATPSPAWAGVETAIHVANQDKEPERAGAENAPVRAAELVKFSRRDR
jgi:hypothetical protein